MKPTVVIVEPYAQGSRGHHARAVDEARSALESIGWRTTVADPADTTGTRLAGKACGILAKALRPAAGAARRMGAETLWTKASNLRASMHALEKELPYLIEARRIARAMGQVEAAFILLTTSYVRPLWIKGLICRQLSVVEIVFEPVIAAEHIRSKRLNLAATTPRIEQTIRVHTSISQVICQGHFPVQPAIPSTDAHNIRSELLEAVGRLDLRGRWILYFGKLHGKKDTLTVIRSAPYLNGSSSIFMVGDPGFEGTHLPPDIQDTLERDPAIDFLFEPVSDEERLWLFNRSHAVLVAQRPRVASMSGSLPDAMAYQKPIVAAKDTATGDAVRDLGVGESYTSEDPESLAAAINSVLQVRAPIVPDASALSRHGLLDPKAWARELVAVAEPSRATSP